MINRCPKTGKILRTYFLDESYFDVIDNQDKAYFLGFLYADGYNNTKRGSVILSLKEIDLHILEDLNKLLQPTKPLQYIDYKGKQKSTNQYRLVVSSRKISNALVNLGCGNKKTFILKFPNNEQVPFKLIHHFVRGYFDGDGSVNNGKREHISVVGTREFLTDLQLLLIQQLNFTATKFITRFPERNNNITSLVYCGVNRCNDFSNWLYKDANLYLNRKKAVFDNYKIRRINCAAI